MIESPYDFKKFIEDIREKDYPEIVLAAERAAYEAERKSFRIKGSVKAREQGSLRYIDLLKKFLFFMNHGVKPAGITDWDFLMFRSVCENLVKKGQFKPEVLDIFK